MEIENSISIEPYNGLYKNKKENVCWYGRKGRKTRNIENFADKVQMAKMQNKKSATDTLVFQSVGATVYWDMVNVFSENIWKDSERLHLQAF